jgi:nitrite reductase/ring-hydroxylating ferredoxin subunit
VSTVTIDRRRLLRGIGWGALGAVIGSGGLCAFGRDEEELPLSLGTLSGLAPGAVRVFPEHEVALWRSPRGLVFLRTRCTHLGCPLRLVGREWRCGCHGGRFALDGAVLAGPPRAPLEWIFGSVGVDGRVQAHRGRRNRARLPFAI